VSVSQGRLAECIFESECLRRGFHIYEPIVDNHGVDYLIKNGSDYISIQVKSTYSVDLRYPNKPSYRFSMRKGHDTRNYDEGDFDFAACYAFQINTWYIIPMSELGKKTIRVNPASPNCKYYKFINSFYLLSTNPHP
jgi:hypothetical protein